MPRPSRGRQQIPRPPSARPGEPAPWFSISPEHRSGIDLRRVRQAMTHAGPADAWPDPGGRVAAAVLVPIFEEDGEARIILTRRSSSLRSHTGEVSFPGGRLDEGEAPLDAALREASEEIGLDPAAVEILGQLAPLATLSARSGITPFVGALPGRPQLSPNPAEVELAFDVAIADLLHDDTFEEERWDFAAMADRPIYFFHLPDDIVWGATARILYELLGLVAFVS